MAQGVIMPPKFTPQCYYHLDPSTSKNLNGDRPTRKPLLSSELYEKYKSDPDILIMAEAYDFKAKTSTGSETTITAYKYWIFPSIKEFLDKYREQHPDHRKWFTIAWPYNPVALYFDFDSQVPPPPADVNVHYNSAQTGNTRKTPQEFIEHVKQAIFCSLIQIEMIHGIDVSPLIIDSNIILNACSDTKFSYHIHVYLCFESQVELGACMKTVMNRLEKQLEAEDPLVRQFCWISMERPPKTKRDQSLIRKFCSYIDQLVYTPKRLFRIAFSRKPGRNNHLIPEYIVKQQQQQQQQQQQKSGVYTTKSNLASSIDHNMEIFEYFTKRSIINIDRRTAGLRILPTQKETNDFWIEFKRQLRACDFMDADKLQSNVCQFFHTQLLGILRIYSSDVPMKTIIQNPSDINHLIPDLIPESSELCRVLIEASKYLSEEKIREFTPQQKKSYGYVCILMRLLEHWMRLIARNCADYEQFTEDTNGYISIELSLVPLIKETLKHMISDLHILRSDFKCPDTWNCLILNEIYMWTRYIFAKPQVGSSDLHSRSPGTIGTGRQSMAEYENTTTLRDMIYEQIICLCPEYLSNYIKTYTGADSGCSGYGNDDLLRVVNQFNAELLTPRGVEYFVFICLRTSLCITTGHLQTLDTSRNPFTQYSEEDPGNFLQMKNLIKIPLRPQCIHRITDESLMKMLLDAVCMWRGVCNYFPSVSVVEQEKPDYERTNVESSVRLMDNITTATNTTGQSQKASLISSVEAIRSSSVSLPIPFQIYNKLPVYCTINISNDNHIEKYAHDPVDTHYNISNNLMMCNDDQNWNNNSNNSNNSNNLNNNHNWNNTTRTDINFQTFTKNGNHSGAYITDNTSSCVVNYFKPPPGFKYAGGKYW